MNIVVDASVTIKWLLKDTSNEPNMVEALRLLHEVGIGKYVMIQPPHWLAEVVAVLARLQPSEISLALESLGELGGKVIVGNDDLYLRAAEFSHRLNHHLFDTLYHAVALENGAVLVTADERYFKVAKDEGAIQLLKDFRTA